MCARGSWRGFHTRVISGTLAAMEQCTQCGDYRARSIENCAFVEGDEARRGTQASERQSDELGDIPDPDSGDGAGSRWGPDVSDSRSENSW